MFIRVKLLPVILLLFTLFWGTRQSTNKARQEEGIVKLCAGNRLKHFGKLGLEKHNDISEVLKIRQGKYNVGKLMHKDQNEQTYTLSFTSVNVQYQK